MTLFSEAISKMGNWHSFKEVMNELISNFT